MWRSEAGGEAHHLHHLRSHVFYRCESRDVSSRQGALGFVDLDPHGLPIDPRSARTHPRVHFGCVGYDEHKEGGWLPFQEEERLWVQGCQGYQGSRTPSRSHGRGRRSSPRV